MFDRKAMEQEQCALSRRNVNIGCTSNDKRVTMSEASLGPILKTLFDGIKEDAHDFA